MARRAVLFDLDGTVWDSHPWVAAVAGDGDRPRQERTLQALQSRRPAATVLRQAGITRTAFAELARGEHRAALYPGAYDTLQQLAADGVALGAVTNLPGWMANAMLVGLQLDALLPVVVTYERTTLRKPHPDPLLLALTELGVRPTRRSWYVGDTDGDCRAAAAAGLSFAWVSWGYEPHPPAGAHLRLDSFGEVLSL